MAASCSGKFPESHFALVYFIYIVHKIKANSNGAGEEDEDTMDIDGVIAFMEELGLEQNDNALVRSSRLAANH